MFTMHDSSELVQEALRAGAQAYILKSNPAELLVGAVAAIAAGATRSGAPRNEAVQARRDGSAGAPPLTPREHEIAQLLAAGKTNGCVATTLGISIKTVETHRTKIMQKLRLKSVVELVHYAVRNRMVTP
jgi:DNA-binding NarL/FixJ family response regulator